jgi:glycosyltransferase involved in cell wall biosynthesis
MIWTHSEDMHLAFGLLKALRMRIPRVVAQSIWLPEGLANAGPFRGWWYRRLLRSEFQHVSHTSINARLLSEWDARLDSRVALYGISPDLWMARDGAPEKGPTGGDEVHVVAFGNDRHRDWTAMSGLADSAVGTVRVSVASKVVGVYELSEGRENMSVTPVSSVDAARGLLGAADIVAVPLRSNSHASGITAILEAVYAGRPVVASSGGGLEEYFPAGTIFYVERNALPADWLEAIRAALGCGRERVEAVRRFAFERRLTSAGYTERLLALSEDYLEKPYG